MSALVAINIDNLNLGCGWIGSRQLIRTMFTPLSLLSVLCVSCRRSRMTARSRFRLASSEAAITAWRIQPRRNRGPDQQHRNLSGSGMFQTT
jgi:hypothetical protein